ncbi:hypothetical protein WN944_018881 [Citrus x changshan-huyou]|uniref:Sulfotransferase n=1 Tax=Citrus x changshan-huyou TaxID=2935761 RepID=A0AAP0LUF6_9ROSI
MATASSIPSQELLDQLPKHLHWEAYNIYQWEGFWYPAAVIRGMLAFRSNYKARCDDVILASSLKTGTTWLKALCACIMDYHDDQLSSKNPHLVVKTLEYEFAGETLNPDDLSGMPSPRLFHTHLPYSALPESIKNSECKIVYITRNPSDTMVSGWHYFNKILRRNNQDPYPFEKEYNNFCAGVHSYGPFFDHVLRYWSESLKTPNKILFLKYEELKRDPKGQVKRLASFLGQPLAGEDEVDKVIWGSSFERLKNLEVNKNGELPFGNVPNSAFFRLGKVGDWENYFTAEMKQGLDEITRMKLEGSGLDFES